MLHSKDLSEKLSCRMQICRLGDSFTLLWGNSLALTLRISIRQYTVFLFISFDQRVCLYMDTQSNSISRQTLYELVCRGASAPRHCASAPDIGPLQSHRIRLAGSFLSLVFLLSV